MKKHLKLLSVGLLILWMGMVSWHNWFSNTFPATGNVGIGTTTPSYPLDVTANGAERMYSDSNFKIQQQTTAAATQGIQFLGWDYAVRAFFYMNVNTGEVRIGSGPGGYFTTMYANNSEAARFDASQRFLVGYTSNQDGNVEQVNGTVSAKGFKMSTGATNGYVLTSDANGNGSWTAANQGHPDLEEVLDNGVGINANHNLIGNSSYYLGFYTNMFMGSGFTWEQSTIQTTPYTINGTTCYSRVYTTSATGNMTINLPSANSTAGSQLYIFKRENGTGGSTQTITIKPNGTDTIEGASSYTGLVNNFSWVWIIQLNDSEWGIIGKG